MKPTRVLVIAPAHNEENGIKNFVSNVFFFSPNSSILIVDDASKDETWTKVKELKEEFPSVFGIQLQSNVGQQRAILAGLEYARKSMPEFDFYISMDSDGQDPEECIPKMIEKAIENNVDMVVGYRSDRTSDSVWKRYPANLFYYSMKKFFKVKLTSHAAEFRVLSPLALDQLLSYKEARPFWRGLAEFSGIPKINFEYSRRERKADSTSYGIKEMLRLAESGITSFSQVPLRFIFKLGLTITILSFLAIGVYLASYVFFGSNVEGWLSLILVSLFFGGIQMFSLGIMGIYQLEILENVRRRPQYFIKSQI